MTSQIQGGVGAALDAYPHYQSISLGWLNEIPSDWSVRRLRSTAERCQNGIWGEEPGPDDDGFICIRVADFSRQDASLNLQEPTRRTVEERYLDGRLVKNGDLLLEKSGGGEQQPVGFVVLVEGLSDLAICSNFIARMPVREGHDPRFLKYLHQCLYSLQLNTRSIKQTTGIQNLDSDAYLSELVPVPPLSTQRSIANFLDRETSRIDKLIDRKKRLIELLEEKRTAVITQTVTMGLDLDIPMKDSGVEWLGDIPENWDVSKVKHVARMESGHTPDRETAEYWDGGIQWLSLADFDLLKQVDVVEETAHQISEAGLANSSARLLPPDTVAFSRDATVGLCALLGREMAVSQHFIGWVCLERILPRYLLLVLRCMEQELDRLTMGATIRTLGLPEVSSLVTPLPSRREQSQIVRHVSEVEEEISALMDRATRAISLLQEYRSALISAAVTGRIDVRGHAA